MDRDEIIDCNISYSLISVYDRLTKKGEFLTKRESELLEIILEHEFPEIGCDWTIHVWRALDRNLKIGCTSGSSRLVTGFQKNGYWLTLPSKGYTNLKNFVCL
jgi:hypothetical protein